MDDKGKNKINNKSSLSWGPSSIGKFFTPTTDWYLTLKEQSFLLSEGNNKHQGDIFTLETLQIKPGAFWATVIFPVGKQGAVILDGIPNDTARDMHNSVLHAITAIRNRQRQEALLKKLPLLIRPVLEWSSKALTACKAQLKVKGWLTHEFKIKVNQSKPRELETILAETVIREHLKVQPENIQNAIKF